MIFRYVVADYAIAPTWRREDLHPFRCSRLSEYTRFAPRVKGKVQKSTHPVQPRCLVPKAIGPNRVFRFGNRVFDGLNAFREPVIDPALAMLRW